MAKRKNQELHDRMVHGLLEHLEHNGFADIEADVVDYDAPSKICWEDTTEGHIPDATAVKDGVAYIFEVETADSIAITDTARQWRLFDEYARRCGKAFVVAVPLGCAGEAREQLDRLDIGAALWEIEIP